MSNSIQYTTIDRILANVHRNYGSDLNEADAIEWIADALDFLKVYNTSEEIVTFCEVKNFEVNIPAGFQMLLQVAKNNEWTAEDKDACNTPTTTADPEVAEVDPAYQPYVDIEWQYISWTLSPTFAQQWTPVRLANHTFFKSVVCKETNNSIYEGCEDEYTIVGTTDRKLRFSFEEGYVALSYLRTPIDSETKYPLIPDNVSYITAITYYLKWKMAEKLAWNGRDGFEGKADKAEAKWLKYCRQAKNFMKMPKGLAQHQNMLEQSHYLVPRHKRFYGFFGKLGRAEDRPFNGPENRRY